MTNYRMGRQRTEMGWFWPHSEPSPVMGRFSPFTTCPSPSSPYPAFQPGGNELCFVRRIGWDTFLGPFSGGGWLLGELKCFFALPGEGYWIGDWFGLDWVGEDTKDLLIDRIDVVAERGLWIFKRGEGGSDGWRWKEERKRTVAEFEARLAVFLRWAFE